MQQLLSEDRIKHSDGHIRSILFQAKVDSANLHRSLELPPRVISRHRMMDEVVKLVVDTIYLFDNISRLEWLQKKCLLLSLKQTAIDYIAVMKSLVLKRDVQEIYIDYLSKLSSQFPADIPFMKKSLFYTITREISGGSRKQASRAGIDYIKVNFHHDNFEIVEKIIDTVAPASDADQSLRLQLYQQKTTVFTYLSYTNAQHVLEGVIYQYDSSQQLKKEEMDCTKMEAIKEICSIFPQCQLCYRHFKSAYCKMKHKCKGSTRQCNAISTALH